jgi:hypothetical protein
MRQCCPCACTRPCGTTRPTARTRPLIVFNSRRLLLMNWRFSYSSGRPVRLVRGECVRCCDNTGMHSYLIALRISGPTLDVAEVTVKLRLKPTQTRVAGQPHPGGKSVWDESMWEYEVHPSNSKSKRQWSSLEGGLKKTISAFRSRKRTLRHYQQRFKVCLFLRTFFVQFQRRPDVFSLPAKGVRRFGRRTILRHVFLLRGER